MVVSCKAVKLGDGDRATHNKLFLLKSFHPNAVFLKKKKEKKKEKKKKEKKPTETENVE